MELTWRKQKFREVFDLSHRFNKSRLLGQGKQKQSVHVKPHEQGKKTGKCMVFSGVIELFLWLECGVRGARIGCEGPG